MGRIWSAKWQFDFSGPEVLNFFLINICKCLLLLWPCYESVPTPLTLTFTNTSGILYVGPTAETTCKLKGGVNARPPPNRCRASMGLGHRLLWRVHTYVCTGRFVIRLNVTGKWTHLVEPPFLQTCGLFNTYTQYCSYFGSRWKLWRIHLSTVYSYTLTDNTYISFVLGGPRSIATIHTIDHEWNRDTWNFGIFHRTFLRSSDLSTWYWPTTLSYLPYVQDLDYYKARSLL